MVYQWKPASYIKADAQKAGELCEELANQGMLTARNLVEVSRPEDAPLHSEFEWDDETAAEKYREYQAAHIICCLVRKDEDVIEPVRAFFTLSHRNCEYESLEVILQDADKTEALLTKALGELGTFRRKYQQLKELSRVMEAIATVI